MKVWCVRHRTGWCATATGKQHRDGANSVKTKRKHYIILSGGSAHREPTCSECRRKA